MYTTRKEANEMTYMGNGCLARKIEERTYKVFLYRTSVNRGTDCFAGSIYTTIVRVPEENDTKFKDWEIAVGLLEDAINAGFNSMYTKKQFLTLNDLYEEKKKYFKD